MILHGDAPNENPSYQYAFAERVVEGIPGTIAVAPLRPGYADGFGAQSQGTRGLTTGDNYTPEDVDALDGAIRSLQSKLHAARIILVGHSGGAAIAADILGRHPTTARYALLVGCPCDVPAWRSYMMRKQLALIWNQPVRSLSPLSLAPGVAKSARVELIVGQQDDVAPQRFSDGYVAALKAHGVNARLIIAPNLGHNIFNTEFVFEHLKAFACSALSTQRVRH